MSSKVTIELDDALSDAVATYLIESVAATRSGIEFREKVINSAMELAPAIIAKVFEKPERQTPDKSEESAPDDPSGA